jgi:hypothetical protein
MICVKAATFIILKKERKEEEEAKVTLFEDMTGTITNGTILIKLNYRASPQTLTVLQN